MIKGNEDTYKVDNFVENLKMFLLLWQILVYTERKSMLPGWGMRGVFWVRPLSEDLVYRKISLKVQTSHCSAVPR